MSQDLLVQIFRDFLKTILLLAGPPLMASMAVGLLVAVFQAATQIHESTLVFVPKLLIIMLALLVLSPWMINVMVTYTSGLITNIPTYVR
jgi:flagellar biosynthesis protein FliQ